MGLESILNGARRLGQAALVAGALFSPFGYSTARADPPNNTGTEARAETPEQRTARLEREYQAAMTQGRTLFTNRDYTGAVAQFTTALEKKANDYVALNDRAACFLNLRNYDNAIRDASAAVNGNPALAGAYANLGAAQYRKAESEKDTTLARQGFHNLFIAKEIAYTLNLTNVTNNLNIQTYQRNAARIPEFRGLDSSENANKITRSEQSVIGRHFYTEKELAASHYFLRQVVESNSEDDLGKEAARYVRRLERKMRRGGINAIALSSFYSNPSANK